MSPGPVAELLGQIAYHFTLIQPYIPTYLHLLMSALLPIYTGAHASLARPPSAAKPLRRKKAPNEEDDDGVQEVSQRMEGLSPSDAILYPLLTGCMLAGLYFLIKWLKDPAILNKILNWYLSVFGLISIEKFLSDCFSTIISYIFPKRYSEGDVVWEISVKKRHAAARMDDVIDIQAPANRNTPLPGLLSRLPLPKSITRDIWKLRDLLTQPLYIVELYIRGLLKTKLAISYNAVFSFFIAVAAVLYFNLIDKPWWLTNLLGFSFSYSVLQLMSPTTFWTGTLVLTSLFFYDIYFVFFTPLMITVATKLDIPVKLLFPRPSGADDDPSKKPLSMLGLGDIVLPGIMIGLALRFDLYLFYLKKQSRRTIAKNDADEVKLDIDETEHSADKVTSRKADMIEEIVKAPYISATGNWGERFWLSHQQCIDFEGGSFPKVYFHASIIGYTIGMLCTLGVMHIYRHGQPALLYLVPGVLLSLWGTAFAKGDTKTMWEYTEAEETEEKDKKDAKFEKEDDQTGDEPTKIPEMDTKSVEQKSAECAGLDADGSVSNTMEKMVDTSGTNKILGTTENSAAKCCVFSFVLSLPPSTMIELSSELREVKEARVGQKSGEVSSKPGSSSSPNASTSSRRYSDPEDLEPAVKRPRLE